MDKNIVNIQRSFKFDYDTENNTVNALVMVFNSRSEDLGGYREMINRNALDKNFLDTQDIFVRYNHDRKLLPLARSKYGSGNLNYTIDDTGVRIKFELKNKEIEQAIRDGVIDSCSFSAIVRKNDYVLRKNGDEYVYEIMRFKKITDFSLVDVPAYSETSVSMRFLEDKKELEAVEDQEIRTEVEKLKAFENYYKKIKAKYFTY